MTIDFKGNKTKISGVERIYNSITGRVLQDNVATTSQGRILDAIQAANKTNK